MTKYKSHLVTFTPPLINKIKDLIKSGKMDLDVTEYRDATGTGLTIRITKHSASWYIRHRNISVRISDLSMTLETAKYITNQSNIAIKHGRDPRSFVKILASLEHCSDGSIRYQDPTGNIEIATNWSDPNTTIGSTVISGDSFPWKWKDLRRNFLSYKLPTLKPTYRSYYERILTLSAFEEIENLRIAQLQLSHLERVRDVLLKRHAVSTVHTALQQVKSMLGWAWRYQAYRAGMEEMQYEWWQRVSVLYHCGQREHVPFIKDLTDTLAAIDLERRYSEPMHRISSGTFAALWMVVLTAQRTGSLVALRRDQIFEYEMKDGWKVLHWTRDQMKGGRDGGRPHSLPIPPDAFYILENCWREDDLSRNRNCKWAFPSAKVDGHLHKSALNLLFSRLRGTRHRHRMTSNNGSYVAPIENSNPKSEQSIFQKLAIEPWTPHDVRRTIASFLFDAGLTGAASAILAHKTDAAREERRHVADVTRTHYAFSAQQLTLKANGMDLWVRKVLDMYQISQKEVEARWTDA